MVQHRDYHKKLIYSPPSAECKVVFLFYPIEVYRFFMVLQGYLCPISCSEYSARQRRSAQFPGDNDGNTNDVGGGGSILLFVLRAMRSGSIRQTLYRKSDLVGAAPEIKETLIIMIIRIIDSDAIFCWDHYRIIINAWIGAFSLHSQCSSEMAMIGRRQDLSRASC